MDLDALAAELRATTVPGLTNARLIGDTVPVDGCLRVPSGLHGGWLDVDASGVVTLHFTVTNSRISAAFLATLDIIRRHADLATVERRTG